MLQSVSTKAAKSNILIAERLLESEKENEKLCNEQKLFLFDRIKFSGLSIKQVSS